MIRSKQFGSPFISAKFLAPRVVLHKSRKALSERRTFKGLNYPPRWPLRPPFGIGRDV